MRDTPFDYLQHLVTVPVRLNGQERRFVLDSGIGLDLVRDTVEGVVANGRSFALVEDQAIAAHVDLDQDRSAPGDRQGHEHVD